LAQDIPILAFSMIVILKCIPRVFIAYTIETLHAGLGSDMFLLQLFLLSVLSPAFKL
jgi:hypothetical protein